MTEPEVTRATSSDRRRVVDTVVAAFHDEPAFRYFFDGDVEQATAFATYLFNRRVGHDTVWIVDGGASVAMWEQGPALGEPTGDEEQLVLAADTLHRLAEYNNAVHPLLPHTPHAYLGILATHPDSWGRRWGRAVMAAGRAWADAAGVPAYLETTTESNVRMYERAGWEVTDFVTAATVPVWVMRARSQATGEQAR